MKFQKIYYVSAVIMAILIMSTSLVNVTTNGYAEVIEVEGTLLDTGTDIKDTFQYNWNGLIFTAKINQENTLNSEVPEINTTVINVELENPAAISDITEYDFF